MGSPDRATSELSSPPTPVTSLASTHSVSGDTGVPEDIDDSSRSNGLVKTRSYDDIIAACDDRENHVSHVDQPRRCSDSSINVDL